MKVLPLQITDLPATPAQPPPEPEVPRSSSNSADAANPFFVPSAIDRPDVSDKRSLSAVAPGSANSIPSPTAQSNTDKDRKLRNTNSDSSVAAGRLKGEDNSSLPSSKEIREASGKAGNAFRRGLLKIVSLIVSFFRMVVYRPWRRLLHYTWVLRTGFFNILSVILRKYLSYLAGAVAVLFLGVAMISMITVADKPRIIDPTSVALPAETAEVFAYKDVRPVFPERRVFVDAPNQRGLLVPDAILPP